MSPAEKGGQCAAPPGASCQGYGTGTRCSGPRATALARGALAWQGSRGRAQASPRRAASSRLVPADGATLLSPPASPPVCADDSGFVSFDRGPGGPRGPRHSAGLIAARVRGPAQRLATALPSRRLRRAPPRDPVGQRPESPAVRAPVFSASSCGTGSLHPASAPRPPRGGRVCDRETQAVQRRQGTRRSREDAAARRASAAQRGPARGRHRVDPRTAAALPALRLG